MKRRHLHILKRVLGLLLMVGLFAFGTQGDIYTDCSAPLVIIDHEEDRMFVDYADVVELVQQVCHNAGPVPTDQASLSAIEQRLHRHPAVRQAEVWFGVNGTLHIRIQQRQPLALVENQMGERCYLDTEGYTFPADVGEPARVCYVNGFISCQPSGDHISQNSTLQAIHAVTTEMQNRPFWKAWVEQIWLEPDTQMVFIPKMGKHEIHFGPAKEIARKLNKLDIFYTRALSATGWDQYTVIDARYKGQIIAKGPTPAPIPVTPPDTLAL